MPQARRIQKERYLSKKLRWGFSSLFSSEGLLVVVVVVVGRASPADLVSAMVFGFLCVCVAGFGGRVMVMMRTEETVTKGDGEGDHICGGKGRECDGRLCVCVRVCFLRGADDVWKE